MFKILLLTLALFLSSCCQSKTYIVPDSEIKGNDIDKNYELHLTEKGLRRLKIAIVAYKKGSEYSKGYDINTLLITATTVFIVGMGCGYVATK